MKINLKFLENATPCQRRWFIKTWGEDFEFASITVLIEAVKQLEQKPAHVHVIRLLNKFPELQTGETLNYLKSLGLDAFYVSYLLESCQKYRTDEMFEHIMTLHPNAWDIAWVIAKCKEYQTEDRLATLYRFEPSKETIDTVKLHCPELFEEHKQ